MSQIPASGAQLWLPTFSDEADEPAEARKAALLSLAAHYTDLDADVRADLDTVLNGTRSEVFKTQYAKGLAELVEVLGGGFG